jgi:hypothetical protein
METDDTESNNYKALLQNEINKLICNEWKFLNENWKLILNKYNHRTELKEIKNDNIKIVRASPTVTICCRYIYRKLFFV